MDLKRELLRHTVSTVAYRGGKAIRAKGKPVWHDSAPLDWRQEGARFFGTLAAFDAYLAGEAPLAYPAEQIFQGPIADALTHIGQIAFLRRLAEDPIRGENYFKAAIEIGRVGLDQAPSRVEFD